ncbi:hypothetical protein VTP01DRAFT_4165 [Rhizomucor pusillus]|uniref:uncharacterized protein n=1 Tax=Rhizomucor pusillus TaxID=4840 RepID=UPI003741F158
MQADSRRHGAEYIELSGTAKDSFELDKDDRDGNDDGEHARSGFSEERAAILERRYSDIEHHPLTASRGSSSSSLEEPFDSLEHERKLTKTQERTATHLTREAFPMLVVSVIGLILAGVLMDKFQAWDVFLKTPELFILLPILLNLKGNLEMNLAARFSTSANLGDLDHAPTRHSLITGNLALLQVQALVSGAIAGVASFALGIVTKKGNGTSFYESMYMTSSAMVSACVSSGILGVFMCGLILLCRRLNVDPDNIACPMASSTGDIITLILLGGCAVVLQKHMESLFSTVVFIIMGSFVPLFGFMVHRNKHVKDLLFAGWTPILVAMVISSLAGVVLEEYVEEFKGVALVTPVLIGLAGNLGSIYASRISTCLHSETVENYRVVELTLLAMNIPVQLVFLLIIWGFGMGQLTYNFWFFFVYFVVSMLCTWICLKIGKMMTLAFWKLGYDPDNYVIPYLTASIDVIGTAMLVAAFAWLTSSGADDMKASHEN